MLLKSGSHKYLVEVANISQQTSLRVYMATYGRIKDNVAIGKSYLEL